ncbi:GPN-loop GTPase 1, partial [Fragariocoptes setiger]
MEDSNPNVGASTSEAESVPTKAEPATTEEKANTQNNPTCLIVMGMAGSGKTTFVQKLAEHLYDKETPGYLINLDPACHDLAYPANIDIRDTVNYKQMMQEYGLGPNGAIMTSLNLFTTKFNHVMALIDQRSGEHDHFVFDTPGQIEVFNWSASGMIITETLSSSYRTAIVYVLDTVRNKNPATFMSNMLYACSILFKTKLPMIIVLNKTDLEDPSFALQWIEDFESFQMALDQETTYISNLTRSLSLVLDTFYHDLKPVALSSATGDGMDKFLNAIEVANLEYDTIYKPEYERVKLQAIQSAFGKSEKSELEKPAPKPSET